MDQAKPTTRQENHPPATDLSQKLNAVKLQTDREDDFVLVAATADKTTSDKVSSDKAAADLAAEAPKPKVRRVTGLKLKAQPAPASDGLRRFALRVNSAASGPDSAPRTPGFMLLSKERPKLHLSDHITEWRGFELGKCSVLTPSVTFRSWPCQLTNRRAHSPGHD